MTHDVQSAAASYFCEWKNSHVDTLRSILIADAAFRARSDRPEIRRVHREPARWVAEPDRRRRRPGHGRRHRCADLADLHTMIGRPTPNANWRGVEDSRIAAIRVTIVHDPSAAERIRIDVHEGVSHLDGDRDERLYTKAVSWLTRTT